MEWLTVPLGLVVGLALGALGGGGSVLAVPSLVYVLGETPRQATTASLLIVVLSSLVAVAGHARAGRVKVRQGLGFGLSGLVTSTATAALSKDLPPALVLSGFAVVMLVAAAVMWRGSRGDRRAGAGRSVPRWKAAAAGAGVGVLIGVFGVGGGFLAVPALVSVAGFTMSDAIGTSLLVIVVNSAAALATRFAGSDIEWDVVLPFAVAASVGALGGQRVADRLSGPVLQRAFAVMLVGLAAFVLVDQLAT